jgi:hypothetical protein
MISEQWSVQAAILFKTNHLGIVIPIETRSSEYFNPIGMAT